MLRNVIILLPDHINKSLILNVEIEHLKGRIQQQQNENKHRDKRMMTRDALLYCCCIVILGD